MLHFKKNLIRLAIVVILGIIPAVIAQFFVKEPSNKNIHIRSFRYGKDPSVIRCNRGDTLHLTFSTYDTGHSFFLQEFDVDAKVSPGREEVSVFKAIDPTESPIFTKELTLVAEHPGIQKYIISKSNYRCHVWCGPMHAFEQGKLIIFPNTLFVFSLGSLFGIIILWVIGIFRNTFSGSKSTESETSKTDLLSRSKILRKILISRWPQLIFTLIAMLMIYIVILTSVFGTKVSGRNLGVLLMWAIWLFVLVAALTPFFGRIWCTICPLPFFGDLIQRNSVFSPQKGRTKKYNNKFYGLFLKWPEWLNNSWLKLFFFLILATFSTTLVAVPRISGMVVLILLLTPTLMAFIWEHRAFCRFLCPVSVFINSYARMAPFELRSKSQAVCDQCKPNYCQKGSAEGWACPYGLNVGEIRENTDCGLCLECTRSCLYNNVAVFKRPFAKELGTRNLSEAWLSIAVFTIAIVYCILYLGHWPAVRDYINIVDKGNWNLFAVYSLILWSLSLIIVPGILFIFSMLGAKISKVKVHVKNVFFASAGSLLPFGLMLWIAFVIPMLFVNVTFILQSLSDPFGWGWDFFGTANMPWHQFLPQYIPWIQAMLVLGGLHLSLRNLGNTWKGYQLLPAQVFKISIPVTVFIVLAGVGMLAFFTN
jgi:polyferredoxin